MEHYPEIVFASSQVSLVSPNEALVDGALAIRGQTRTVVLEVHYLGQWETPWWENGVDKGPKVRAGFVATTSIDRHDSE